LLVAELSRQAAGEHAQDRPLVHSRSGKKPQRPVDRDRDHFPGALDESDGGGGGRGNRGPVAAPAGAQVRRDSGLPLQPADAAGGNRKTAGADRGREFGRRRPGSRIAMTGFGMARDKEKRHHGNKFAASRKSP